MLVNLFICTVCDIHNLVWFLPDMGQVLKSHVQLQVLMVHISTQVCKIQWSINIQVQTSDSYTTILMNNILIIKFMTFYDRIDV